MSNIIIKNITVDIGYEADVSDSMHTGKPPMAQVFDRVFQDQWWQELARPEDHLLTAEEARKDLWVAEYLQTRLNGLIKKEIDRVAVNESHLRQHAKDAEVELLATLTGDHGTACRQRGDRWVNSRTYQLLYSSNHRLWHDDRDPTNAFVMATVNWLCWQRP